MSIKFWILHNRSRMVTALVFCLVFTLLAFAPPFSTSAHALALVDDSFALIVIALLSSVGITITASSSQVATDWVLERIQAHAAYAGYVWNELKTGFEVGINKVGDILTNNKLLTWFSDFAEWLKTDYGLTDNTDSSLVSPANAIVGNAECLVFNSASTVAFASYAKYSDLPGGEFSNFNFYVESDVYPVYLTYFYRNSNPQPAIYVPNRFHEFKLVNASTGTEFFRVGSTGSKWYAWSYDTNLLILPTINPVTLPSNYNHALITEYLFGDGRITTGSTDYVNADVGTIDIPIDGTNYTDTDGAVIDGFGSWGDTLNDILEKLREWLDAQSPAITADPSLTIEAERDIVADIDTDLLSTENWPGMLPPSAFPQFSFSSIWHYVTDWLGAFSGTLAAVLGISFALPAVSIVYAVIVLSLTLWLLRKVSS